ncbi:S1 family peptidase [Lacimicrobium alkaliphilum]|uniref:Serine protease n=1 Tax=Lacimicrobium alkaliphilum TaxID=1526571 RepID=A0A0U2PFG1_9ALTE|nr:serine protease [Lacimicrobium alkaliphilum]ALS98077.1 hypothetical protein AT746_07240 [Lacimicrobium alkaliphilum]
MSLETTTGFESISWSHPLYGLMAPLIAAHKNVQERMHGTAFVIAPEFAFTAKHVVIDYLKEIQNEDIEQKIADGGHHSIKMTFFMFLMVPLKDGRRVALTAKKTYFSSTGDIAILHLAKPSDIEWSDLAPYPLLRLIPPDPEAYIEALGYPNSSTIRRPDGVVELHTWPRISTGTVREIHKKRRDSLLLNYPCFRVNARLDGGMSGGPVVDSDGRVCGIVSRSYDLNKDEEPIGYAASLWHSAGIVMSDLPGLANDKLRFFDILRRGNVHSCDFHKITAGLDRTGRFALHVEQ